MIKDFKDKVAVVTGAGSGIGRSLALAFARLEMKIVIADVNEKALNDVSEKLMAEGTEVLGLVVDVSDRVVNKCDLSLPPDYSLENATAYFARILKLSGTDIKVLSDQQTKLKDGTPAAEGVVEYRRAGIH